MTPSLLGARDLPLLPSFIAVSRCGSFTAAARELSLAKSVVSDHLRALEERLGVRLIERSTRRLHLTQAGEQVLDAAAAVMAAVRSLEAVVEGQRQQPTGTLRVTAPHDLGLSSMVAPILARLVREHPTLGVELLLDDQVRDLVKDGLDVALRLGPLSESSYVVRRLGSELEVVVASPAVVDRLGSLEQPRDLAGAPWVAHGSLRYRSTWNLRSDRGDKAQVTVSVRAVANGAVAVRALLLEGAGLGAMPAHIVEDDLRAGRLRRVLPGWFHRRLALHALLPTRHSPPRVRAFLGAVTAALPPLGFELS